MYEDTATHNTYTVEELMRRAIDLAEKGRGTTSPNPMVGALIVKDDRIIGEGFHKKAGNPHAEVNALMASTEDVAGATMVVSLEPCNHFGRTPPCTEAIINAGIKKVIVGMIDPNPQCAGSGIKQLRDAGIEVEHGVLADVVARQNEVFIKFITTGRPFIIVKAAMSLDGKIAAQEGKQTAITGEEALRRAHELRNEYDAIMVGVGTARTDNPKLTTRLDIEDTRNPIRIIVDSRAKLPLDSNIVRTANDVQTILATTAFAPRQNREDLAARGIDVLKIDAWDGSVDLEMLLEELGERHISSIMVEGGSKLIASFARAGLVDKYMLFVAPKLIGEQGVDVIGDKLDAVRELRIERVERLGEDILIEAYPR
ncbi:MAG TPA: bifunctional diaminohydroxyphosphoribosylaminopyrimidine deaminase/5-amino-6-(5-phosphoribosylamino)uracil reductase RibD [Candidatus Aquicultor sp.]